ncbi:MAG: hypothetical protein K2Q22_09590, partial [Cytophagales bacterium]|nr:hypothetical protein [Cytophagales bacterium]
MFYYEWADGHSMHDTGVPGSPFGQMTMAVNTNRLYKLRFVDFIPAATNLTLYSSYRAGDRVTFVIQGSPVELIITGNGIQKMTSLAAFNAATGNASYWANNELYVKMVATGANYVAGGTFALRTINNQTATPIKLKSRPYRRGGHPLNTIIGAEEFDYGGQNVAYYSDRLTSSDVLPSGKYNHSTEVRLGEIVSLNKSFTTRQGTVETVIEKTKPNEYWNYTCSIPADGNYDIVMNVGAANASNRIQVLVNDVVVKDTTFARLGATNDLKSFVFPKLALRRGQQVVTFKVFSPNLVFNSFTITPPNTPPVVTLSSPQQTRTNYALATVTLTATATDANGISRVEFYQGTRLIGTDVTAPYILTVSGLGVGTYTFRARAFDALNLTATSAGITIPVVPLVCLATIT